MKKLLAIALCILSAPLFAASPSYDRFDTNIFDVNPGVMIGVKTNAIKSWITGQSGASVATNSPNGTPLNDLALNTNGCWLIHPGSAPVFYGTNLNALYAAMTTAVGDIALIGNGVYHVNSLNIQKANTVWKATVPWVFDIATKKMIGGPIIKGTMLVNANEITLDGIAVTNNGVDGYGGYGIIINGVAGQPRNTKLKNTFVYNPNNHAYLLQCGGIFAEDLYACAPGLGGYALVLKMMSNSVVKRFDVFDSGVPVYIKAVAGGLQNLLVDGGTIRGTNGNDGPIKIQCIDALDGIVGVVLKNITSDTTNATYKNAVSMDCASTNLIAGVVIENCTFKSTYLYGLFSANATATITNILAKNINLTALDATNCYVFSNFTGHVNFKDWRYEGCTFGVNTLSGYDTNITIGTIANSIIAGANMVFTDTRGPIGNGAGITNISFFQLNTNLMEIGAFTNIVTCRVPWFTNGNGHCVYLLGGTNMP